MKIKHEIHKVRSCIYVERKDSRQDKRTDRQLCQQQSCPVSWKNFNRSGLITLLAASQVSIISFLSFYLCLPSTLATYFFHLIISIALSLSIYFPPSLCLSFLGLYSLLCRSFNCCLFIIIVFHFLFFCLLSFKNYYYCEHTVKLNQITS